MKVKFASLAQSDKIGYAYDTEHWSMNAPIESKFRAFNTYGDGLCQHSGDWAITVETLTDYLASLATAMLADEALLKELRYMFASRIPVADFEFCAGVIFKPVSDESPWEKKTRYFSVQLKQLSSTESKRHDNRFTKVETWCDGTAEAIFHMLNKDHHSGFDKYKRAHEMHEWVRECSNAFPKVYMDQPAVFLKWFEDPEGKGDRARQLREAYDACAYLAKSYSLRAGALSALRNYALSIGKPVEEEAA
jgi:hypothetical protein